MRNELKVMNSQQSDFDFLDSLACRQFRYYAARNSKSMWGRSQSMSPLSPPQASAVRSRALVPTSGARMR